MSHLKVAHLNTRASPSSWTLAEIAAENNQVDVFLIQDPPRDAKTTGGQTFRWFCCRKRARWW
jgi:hypothetical protein